MTTTGKIYLPNNTTFEGKIRYGLPFEGKLTYNELGDSFYGTFDRGQPHDGEFALWDGENITIYPDGTQEFGYYRYGLKDKRRKKTWVEEVKRVTDEKNTHNEEINNLLV